MGNYFSDFFSYSNSIAQSNNLDITVSGMRYFSFFSDDFSRVRGIKIGSSVWIGLYFTSTINSFSLRTLPKRSSHMFGGYNDTGEIGTGLIKNLDGSVRIGTFDVPVVYGGIPS